MGVCKQYRILWIALLSLLSFCLLLVHFSAIGPSTSEIRREKLNPVDATEAGLKGNEPQAQLEMRDFEHRVKGEREESLAVIRGRKAVLMDDGTCHLRFVSAEMPLAYESTNEPVFDYGELSSRKAVLHQATGTIRMREDVMGRVSGLEISTEEAVLKPLAGRIIADGFVRVSGLPAEESDASAPNFELFSGHGLTLNMRLRTLTLARNTVTEIGLTPFGEANPFAMPSLRDLRVKSDGPFRYDRHRNTLSWREDVRLEAGDMFLECDQLSMKRNWADPERFGRFGFFTATGDVNFHFDRHTARGKTLETRGSGGYLTLSGNPATVSMGGMQLASQIIHIARHEGRLESVLPGRMIYLPEKWNYDEFGGEKAACPDDDPEPIDWRGAPIEATWRGGMEHNMDSLFVGFRGGVTLKQGEVKIKSDRLDLVLGKDSLSVRSARFEGDVRLTAEPGGKSGALNANRLWWSAEKGTVAEHVTLRRDDEKISSDKMLFDRDMGKWSKK